jgi:D-galactarolactone isomerase
VGANIAVTRFGCDTHIHFYDHRYPVDPAAVLRPPDATPDDYRSEQTALGTERVVVVQPTTYGLDNSCQLDAMAWFGDAARGVMVVDPGVPREELARLTELGVRGARFHMLPGGAIGWEALEVVAGNIAPFGWHIQLQLNGRELPRHLDRLLRLPVDLVVDHVGRFMPTVEPDSPAFAALLTLMDQGATTKLSAPYESSPSGSPEFDDVTRLVDGLVSRAPDRLVWASNWPHPGQADPPTAADLVALRDRWLPTDGLRRQVLVDNPAALYDF